MIIIPTAYLSLFIVLTEHSAPIALCIKMQRRNDHALQFGQTIWLHTVRLKDFERIHLSNNNNLNLSQSMLAALPNKILKKNIMTPGAQLMGSWRTTHLEKTGKFFQVYRFSSVEIILGYFHIFTTPLLFFHITKLFWGFLQFWCN